jgi:hypothetical protein
VPSSRYMPVVTALPPIVYPLILYAVATGHTPLMVAA